MRPVTLGVASTVTSARPMRRISAATASARSRSCARGRDDAADGGQPARGGVAAGVDGGQGRLHLRIGQRLGQRPLSLRLARRHEQDD